MSESRGGRGNHKDIRKGTVGLGAEAKERKEAADFGGAL